MKRTLAFLALLGSGSALLLEALPLSCAEAGPQNAPVKENAFPFMGAISKPEEEDAERRAGDNAFANKDYPVAVSFYTKYLENSRKKGSEEQVRDAYERLLDALLLGRFTTAAQKYLAEYEKRFSSRTKGKIESGLWRGEILFQQGKYAEAETLYRNLLKDLTRQDPRYHRITFSYGLILEKLKKFKEAAGIFSRLWDQEQNTSARTGNNRTFQHAILCYSAAKEWEKANQMLLEYPPLSAGEDEICALLSAYLFLQRYGSDSAAGIWKNLLNTFRKRKDPLWYLVSSSYADAFVKSGDLPLAQDSYRAAFHAASDNSQAHETLQRMVSVLSAAGDSRKAAELAARQLELFHHAMLKGKLKLRTAALLCSAGKYKEALSLYESVYANIASSREEKLKALYEAALILGKTDRLKEASDLLRNNLKGEDEVSCEFLLAEVLVRLGRKQEFIAAYEKIAERWKEHSLKSRMLCMRACVDQNMPQEALAVSEKIRAELKNDLRRVPDLCYLEGAAYSAMRESARASESYKAFLDMAKPGNVLYPLALYHSGILAFTQGHHTDAVKYLSRLKKEYPSHKLIPESSAWLIQAYMILNDEVAMERETWLLAGRYPDSEYALECLFRLAQKYTSDGTGTGREKAVKILTNLAKTGKSPRIQARALYELALYHVKTGQSQQAGRILNRLYDSFPDMDVIADAYYLHGDILRNRSDFRNAIFFYRKTVALQKDTPLAAAANGSIGDCLSAIASADAHNSTGELKAAIAAYREMQKVRNCPAVFDAMGYFRVGRCLEALGQNRKAAVEYLKVLYKFPASEKALHPEAVPWCVRAAEALISLAQRNPLRSTLTHARTALRWLRDSGLLKHQEAAERFEKLKSYQLNP